MALASSTPPILLIHGAANSSGVWRFWQETLAAQGWPAHTLDLRGHAPGSDFDLSHTSMSDYADDVSVFASKLPSKPVLLGWSMGGLVAMMVAALDASHWGLVLNRRALSSTIPRVCSWLQSSLLSRGQ
jgi:pimeloyl-ACP methyl ester carboxylesterase